MLLSLQSTKPDYSHLRTNIQIPWNCEYIKYHVASINTRDILLVTDDDFIEYAWDGGHRRMVFTDAYELNYDDLEEVFTNGNDNHFKVDVAISGEVILTPLVDGFKFTKMTHRAGLVTGLYNVKCNQVFDKDTPFECERPIIDYANKLYLVSKQGQSIKSNIGNIEYTPSVLASIDHVIGKDIPIMVNFETYGKPIKNVVNIDSFKQIELELVDFQYQPVPLMSPMFITIKVKPCVNPKMKLD